MEPSRGVFCAGIDVGAAVIIVDGKIVGSAVVPPIDAFMELLDSKRLVRSSG